MNLTAKLSLLPSLTAIALVGFATLASAQITSQQQSAIRGSCRGDFQSKCSGVTPGGKDALACLQKNVASLSASCKAAVSATLPPPAKPAEAAPPPAPAPAPAAAAPAPAPAPVAAPAQAAPPAAKPAIVSAPPPPAAKPKKAAAPKKPAPAAVVVAPPPEAAPAAAAPMAVPTPEQAKAIKFTCRKDFATYCKGVKQGGMEALECLQRNNPRLLPACKTSLAAAGDAVPPPSAVAPAPTTRTPHAPIVMTAVIGRSCARDLILHCRDIKVGDGQKIACLMERGPKLSVLCKAALKITDPIR